MSALTVTLGADVTALKRGMAAAAQLVAAPTRRMSAIGREESCLGPRRPDYRRKFYKWRGDRLTRPLPNFGTSDTHRNRGGRPEPAVPRRVNARTGFRRFPADILRAQAIGNGTSKRFLPIHVCPHNKLTFSLCRFEGPPLDSGKFGTHFRNQKQRRVLEIQHSINAFIQRACTATEWPCYE